MKNIAAGLCGFFASRNNDLAGYWTIGKLRSLAEQYSQSAVLLDLPTWSIQPPSSEFAQVLADSHRLLQKLASKTGVRLEEITVASIFVDFLPPPWPIATYHKQQWGEQFLVTVTISAGGRADGIVSHAGFCRPHDPDREFRRSGA